jgi:hypothetical protein
MLRPEFDKTNKVEGVGVVDQRIKIHILGYGETMEAQVIVHKPCLCTMHKYPKLLSASPRFLVHPQIA